MTPEDLAPVLALAHAQGRNLHSTEYERFLSLEGAHGLVVLLDGRLLGAVTFIRYFEHGFLGPLLMADGPDAIGLSMVLTGQAVEWLQRGGVPHVEAEASEEEAIILEKMGFARLRRTLVLERPAAPLAAPDGSIPMEDRHLLDVGTLDAAVVGYGRKEFLQSLQRDYPQGARVVERDGEVRGYALMRRSRRGYHLGPVVTAGGEGAIAETLVRDAVATAPAWPVVTLVPEGSPIVPILMAAGFQEVGTLVRMRAGERTSDPAAPPATEWALGSRVTG